MTASVPDQSAAIEAGLASCVRTIAGAKPAMRLKVFTNQMAEAVSYVRSGHVGKLTVIDRLYEAAISTGLVEQHGVDVVQKIIADAFTTAVATPKTNGVHQVGAMPPKQSVTAGLVFDRVADVEAQSIEWVWPGRLARRKLTLIAGDPGLGKSQITADIAARVSIGNQWPDGGTAPSGSSIILSAEDSVADTLRPRLEVAGADLRRLHALRAVVGEAGQRRTFSLQADLALLGQKVKEVGDVALVVADPITSYMGKIDSHRTTDVRAVLEPLAEFAETHNVALLAITHPPKATQAKAMHAITGSLAFVAAARLVFIAVEESDTDRRLLLPVKSNIGALVPGLGFSLVQATTAGGIVASHVVWDHMPVTITANQALHAAAESNKGDQPLREAEEYLRDALVAGPVPAKQVEKEATDLGIAKRTLKRARQRLGVEAHKDGYQGTWMLALPGGSR